MQFLQGGEVNKQQSWDSDAGPSSARAHIPCTRSHHLPGANIGCFDALPPISLEQPLGRDLLRLLVTAPPTPLSATGRLHSSTLDFSEVGLVQKATERTSILKYSL